MLVRNDGDHNVKALRDAYDIWTFRLFGLYFPFLHFFMIDLLVRCPPWLSECADTQIYLIFNYERGMSNKLFNEINKVWLVDLVVDLAGSCERGDWI